MVYKGEGTKLAKDKGQKEEIAWERGKKRDM